MSMLGEYLAAALIETARQRSSEISTNRNELLRILASEWKLTVDEEDVRNAVRILNMCDISYVEDDEFAGTFVVVAYERFERFIEQALAERAKYDEIVLAELDANLGVNIAESREYPYLEKYNRFTVLRKYAAFGETWITTAMTEIATRQRSGALEIPASDRVVKLGDNDPDVDRIKAEASDLSERLRVGNDLGEISRDQADALANEVEGIKESFLSKYIRPSEIKRRATATLKWIAEKAAGTIVGQTAASLLKLIIEFFG